MLKITLDPTFTADVSITVPGQKELGTIPLTFKYRGRKEFKEFADGVVEVVKNELGNEEIKPKVDPNPETFLDFVENWGLSEEFNKKNIDIFLNNYPASFWEIVSKYRELSIDSRLKN